MRVYKVELMVIDFDGVGDEIASILEDTKYPNHCISPKVTAMPWREVDWSDDHPLNGPQAEDAFREMFFEP